MKWTNRIQCLTLDTKKETLENKNYLQNESLVHIMKSGLDANASFPPRQSVNQISATNLNQITQVHGLCQTW